MRKVTVSRMRERYAQTVLTFRITYVKTDNCASFLGTLGFPADVYHSTKIVYNIFLPLYISTRLYLFKCGL